MRNNSASDTSRGRQARNQGTKTMKMKYSLAALPLIFSLAMSAAAQARTNESHFVPQGYETAGREVAAPPWSFACETDQGARQCDEPMWVYGSSRAVSRYKDAF
jgi:hypothetical protein